MRAAGIFSLVMLLAMSGAPASAQGVDCDNLDDAIFEHYLDAELDDVTAQDADGSYPVDQLRDQILAALGDGGDTGDATELSYADLEADMAEAGTTLEAVVDAALAQADETAAISGRPGFTLVSGETLQARFAVTMVKRNIFRVSRSAR